MTASSPASWPRGRSPRSGPTGRAKAADAAEARALVQDGGIHVVLIDHDMPGGDGPELAGELHASTPDMPIALITANVQDEVIARARTVGAAFVDEPVTGEWLRPFLDGAALRLRSATA